MKEHDFPDYMYGDWAGIVADFDQKEQQEIGKPEDSQTQVTLDGPTNIQEAPALTRRSGRSKKQHK